ncbi:hypothetical protein VB716_06100, partial [Synechococcus sp. CCY9201]|uniref:hypothetical protein n=1 Tax=Synechococcus sp. CCY9201 TaxID=174697 RepID=UPI002B1FD164
PPVHMERSGVKAITDCLIHGYFSGFSCLRPAAAQWIWIFQESLATSANNDPYAAANLRVISYRLNGTQLLRNGPRILATGRLDSVSGNDQTNAVVLDSVNTFTPTVAADCRSVDIAVRLNVPNSTTQYPSASSAPENMTFSTGSSVYQ